MPIWSRLSGGARRILGRTGTHAGEEAASSMMRHAATESGEEAAESLVRGAGTDMLHDGRLTSQDLAQIEEHLGQGGFRPRGGDLPGAGAEAVRQSGKTTFEKAGSIVKYSAGAAVIFLVGRQLFQDLAQQDAGDCNTKCLANNNQRQAQDRVSGPNADPNPGLMNPNCNAMPPNFQGGCDAYCGTDGGDACSDEQRQRRGENECGGVIDAVSCGIRYSASGIKGAADFWTKYQHLILNGILIVIIFAGVYLFKEVVKTFVPRKTTMLKTKLKARGMAIGGDKRLLNKLTEIDKLYK